MSNVESGKELGRYELLVPIARGGMAQVWAARLRGSRGFTKLVAVKVILPGGMDNARLEQMFLEEASLAALIHHPNVAETLELGEHEGTLYLVMEWVEGESLRFVQNRAEQRGGLPLIVAANLVGQACAGLHAAHELCAEDGRPLGLVHRDISPQNILVTHTGVVKVVDFGIAKATGRASSLTEAGEIKGKVSYMSPEQLRGHELDRRSDVFALGILLFLLTTGSHPFKGSNPGETVRRIGCGELLARPSELIPDYPEKLEAVVLKALSHDVNERWPNARELLLALEEAVPEAFTNRAENDIRAYLNELLGEHVRKLRDAVRLAREALGNCKPAPPFAPSLTLSVDRTGESRSRTSMELSPMATPSTVLSPPMPRKGPKRRHLLGAASGVVLLGLLALGVHFALRKPSGEHSTTSPVPRPTTAPLAGTAPAAPASAQPPPASIEPPAPPVAESEPAPPPGPTAPAVSSAARPEVPVQQRPRPRKPRRDPWDPATFGKRQ